MTILVTTPLHTVLGTELFRPQRVIKSEGYTVRGYPIENFSVRRDIGWRGTIIHRILRNSYIAGGKLIYIVSRTAKRDLIRARPQLPRQDKHANTIPVYSVPFRGRRARALCTQKGRVNDGKRGWRQKRAGLGEFSSTTSQLHRIREEYFIRRPSFDENERERRRATSPPPTLANGALSLPLFIPLATDY